MENDEFEPIFDKNAENVNNSNEKEIPFWSENPNILLNPAYFTELFPSNDLSYNQKLNAITRMVILLTVVIFFMTNTFRSIVFGVFSVLSIYLVHYYYVLEKKKAAYDSLGSASLKDAFTGLGGQNESNSPALSVLGEDMNKLLESPMKVFSQPTAKNPFNNVLVTDINGDANKKPAPPAYNDQVNQNILAAAKEAVINAHPDQQDISEKLFKDLGEQLTFEQSMRQFYSNPASSTPDDQQAFAEFCYGSMISCAEGNKFACARNAAATRHTFI